MSFQLGNIDSSFRAELELTCDVDLDQCYECGKCTGGCSTTYIMDYTPRKIIKLIKIGAEETLLNCNTPWICVACNLCVDRCPSGINIPRIMDYIREKAFEQGLINPDSINIKLFYELMLESVYKRGRVSEASLAIRYNLRTGQYFKDTDIGRKLFFKGKLKLFPHLIKGRKNMSQIYKKSGKARKEASK